MRGEPLPDGDHIIRYLSPSLVRDGNTKGAGFHLRPTDFDGLSVDWLECLATGGADPLREARRIARARRWNLRPNGRFAVLRVGDVLRAVTTALMKLAVEHNSPRVTHHPIPAENDLPANPAHSLLKELPAHDTDAALVVGDLIAKQVKALHPAVVPTGSTSSQPKTEN